jgi:hypothetical protein
MTYAVGELDLDLAEGTPGLNLLSLNVSPRS